MVKGPLSDRLEYAVLEIVMADPSEATHQDDWGDWGVSVRSRVPEFTTGDLKSAFKRLWRKGVLRLSKPDLLRRNAEEYSGDETDDDRFFFVGPFNASITDEGRSHWDALRVAASGRSIGYLP